MERELDKTSANKLNYPGNADRTTEKRERVTHVKQEYSRWKSWDSISNLFFPLVKENRYIESVFGNIIGRELTYRINTEMNLFEHDFENKFTTKNFPL